jgi:hypothetical protein
MAYYLFPKPTIPTIQVQIKTQVNNKNIYSISPSLQRYLYELMELISKNSQEYEYLQQNIHPYYNGILANGPDDSYYEITEMMYTMRMNTYLDYYVSKNIQILNLGSNSNAILHSRKMLGRNDINNCDLSIFQFSNLFQKMHIIFADYMGDTTKMLIRLCTILAYQAKNGVLIWKIGDCFSPLMIDIVYYISSFYHKTYFIKPVVMDISKSEKYIVCKGFCPSGNYMERIMHLYKMINETKEPIYRFLSVPIPFFFLNKLEEINTIFGQVQLEQIHAILLLIGNKFKQEKIQYFGKTNEQKCLDWIHKHKIPFL